MKALRFSLSGDRIFASIVLILVVTGIAIFASAALGLLARAGATPGKLAVTQILLGLIPGIIALLGLRFVPPKMLLKLVVPVYVLTIILTLLTFTPLGVTINGARRWIELGFTTVQPGEFLKVSVILMMAVYLAHAKQKITEYKHGLIPFAAIVGIPSAILLLQPNTSTVLIIGAACAVMYFLAGAPWRDFAIIAACSIAALTALVFMRPYLMNRVMTFMHPAHNAHTSGYQIQQSLIAIGSGGLLGRGFGQSVQKFNYLPEPVGDSIFAVFGEEFGFLGTVLLILLFVAFAMRGLMIAAEASTQFGALAVTGLTLLITFSAFLNIGAMLSILPLTGLPLPFISHGGTALMSALASVGIILNVAAHRTKKRAAL
ncbi:MAG: cell division protein FtsW [Parcubacteria bacterium C7867-008]|nr:MAG: cell division protein FtsW [Parcubacteria bacterium C7867-008]